MVEIGDVGRIVSEVDVETNMGCCIETNLFKFLLVLLRMKEMSSWKAEVGILAYAKATKGRKNDISDFKY